MPAPDHRTSPLQPRQPARRPIGQAWRRSLAVLPLALLALSPAPASAQSAFPLQCLVASDSEGIACDFDGFEPAATDEGDGALPRCMGAVPVSLPGQPALGRPIAAAL